MTHKQKKWTPKEEKFLKDNFDSMSNPELAEKLGRSISSVEKKAHAMGLRRKGRNKLTSKEGIADAVQQEKRRMDYRQKDKLIRKMIKDKASTEIVVDLLQDIVPKVKFTPRKFIAHPDKGHEEIAVLLLGDSHFGRYSASLMENKMEQLYCGVTKLIKIHRTAYPVNELVINMLGDVVDGDEIFPGQAYEQKFHLMDQMYTYGLPMMVRFLSQLSNDFEKITINCVPGNHGRKSKTTDKRLNFDTIFYKAMEFATANNPRLHWNIEWDWYQVVDIFGWKFLLTHGANIRTWLNIPVYGILQKGMRWKGSLPENYDYLIMGHFHTTWNFRWNDFEVYMNGTWLDNDKWAMEQLGMDSVTKQFLLGVNKKRGVTWSYKIALNRNRRG